MDPCWEDKPHLYKVFVRSGGLFDHSPHWKKERVYWNHKLMEFAMALDGLQASGEDRPLAPDLLELTLDVLLVLVDPEWWREHPPVELTEADERRVTELLAARRRAQDLIPLGDMRPLEVLISSALEVFLRAGYKEGSEGCERLISAMLYVVREAGQVELVN